MSLSCLKCQIAKTDTKQSNRTMLKTIFCRANSGNLSVRLTRNLSGIRQQFHKEHERTEYKSRHYFAYASIPTFLAFFQKKEDEENPAEPSFLDTILPEGIGLLLKKKPVEDDSTSEGKLKTTLKRTILCIRKGEYQKAEQMAHLALRMAQDIQSYDGITFCYDIMANLAFETEQYQKAEKLYESVLQRLLQKGVPQDDIQILHISLKVAQLVELQNKKDEAKTNYAWTISKLDEKRQKEPENQDIYELWGLTSSFYGKFLLKNGKFKEAVERLKNSRDVFIQVRGRYEPEYVDILNNLAVASLHVNDFDSADQFIDEAILLASAYPELMETGIYHANKALICLRKGLLDEAQRYCKHADQASRRSNDPDGKEQAKYCLEQVEKALKKKK